MNEKAAAPQREICWGSRLLHQNQKTEKTAKTYRYAKVRDSYRDSQSSRYFYYYNEYKDIGSKEEVCVIIGAPLEEFQETIDALLAEDGIVSVYSGEKELLYRSSGSEGTFDKIGENLDFESGEGSFQTKEEEENWLHLYTAIPSVKWELVSSVKTSSILQGFEEWWRISIFCMAGVLVAVLLAVYYLNRSLLGPVNKLHGEMQKVKEGIKDLPVPAHAQQDEIGNLTMQFYDMVNRIEELEQEALLKEKQKHKLEIEALQAQINPHFLYNTINAVKLLLRMKRSEEAAAALTALADILQHTLSDSSQTVTVEDEEKILNSYIFIQKLRYEDFLFKMDIEEQVKKCRIMKFMVQPFIENSFLHGFEEIDSSMKICVSVKEESRFLMVSIRDNGNGMDQKTIEEILQCRRKGRGVNGIGIRNVIERIEKNYGPPYGIEIESQIGKGTCIRLLLPLLREELT